MLHSFGTCCLDLRQACIDVCFGMMSGMMSVIISVTRAGGLDFGGVPQPGYLNFDASLLGPPAGDMTVSHPTEDLI